MELKLGMATDTCDIVREVSTAQLGHAYTPQIPDGAASAHPTAHSPPSIILLLCVPDDHRARKGGHIALIGDYFDVTNVTSSPTRALL